MSSGYVFLTQHGAVLLIKWFKTIQDRKEFATNSIPTLGVSPLCPVMALRLMFCELPAEKNFPFFFCSTKITSFQQLTDSVARKHLKDVLNILGLEKPHTFHDFRRAGASWAFQQGVPLEHIMKHGTWKLNAS